MTYWMPVLFIKYGFITHPWWIAFTWKRSMKHVHCVFRVPFHCNRTAQSFCAPLKTAEYSYDWFIWLW
jgi:hypothetical protein